MTECLECGAPAEAHGGHELAGVDYDGRDADFWVDRILCAAGHRYDLVDNTRTTYHNTAIKEMWD